MAQKKYTQTQQVIDTLFVKQEDMLLLAIYTILLIRNLGQQRLPMNLSEELCSNLPRYLKFSLVFGRWRNAVRK